MYANNTGTVHHTLRSWDQLFIAYRHQTWSQRKLPHSLKVIPFLTSYNTVLQKSVVARADNFFILWHRKALCLVQKSEINSVHTPRPIYLKTILILDSYPSPGLEMFSFLQVFTPKFCAHFSSVPYVPNAVPTHPPLFHHHNIWRVTQINEGPSLLDFLIFPGIVSILLQNIYSIQSMFFPYCENETSHPYNNRQ